MSNVKTSKYTPVLLIGLVVVLIAGRFYSPWGDFDFWEFAVQNDRDMQILTKSPLLFAFVQKLITFAFPVVDSMTEFMSWFYVFALEADKFGAGALLLAGEITILGYVVVLYFIERIHAKIHEEEGVFSLCIDMLCIEHIAMYLFELVANILSDKICTLNVEDDLLMIISYVVCIIPLLAIMFHLLFLFINMTITMMIPALALIFLSPINDWLATIAFVAAIILFQIIWRMISDKIYDWMLFKFTRGKLSIS